MTVRIRLQRHGAKKRPFYRVVAADQRAPRDGRFIEVLGTYDPLQDPPAIRLKKTRVDHWLNVGAQPSETAQWLITKLEAGEALNLSEQGAEQAAAQARKAARAEERDRARAEAKTKAAAAAKAKAEEEAKAKSEAEAAAKAKADEEAKAKAEVEKDAKAEAVESATSEEE